MPIGTIGSTPEAARLLAYTTKQKLNATKERVLHTAGQHCRVETAVKEFAAQRRRHGKQGAKRKSPAKYVLPDDGELAVYVRRSWPRGQMTEVLATDGGVCGAGELSLLTPALARLTEAGGKVVVIFPWPCGWRLHAPAWVGAGVAAGAMLLVRPQNLRDMVWAAVQSARCPGVGAVLCWLDARVPTNSLRRLQVAAGEGGACLFVIRPSGSAP